MPRVTETRAGRDAAPRMPTPRTAAPARGPRGSVSDRPHPWRLRLRRQRRMLRPALWGLAGFAVVLAGTFLTHSGHSGAPGWRDRLGAAMGLRVREVVVEGRANTPEKLLDAAIGVGKGSPILGYSVEAARQRIEKLSWVEHASVERRLPGTIVVDLTERRPFAIWQHNGKFVLIGRDGQVVADQDVSAFGSLPLVVGAGAPAHATDLLDALAQFPALQSRVVAAVRVGERRWNLRLGTGADVLLPEGAEKQALARLVELQSRHALLDRPLAVVDMRLPDRLVVRPQPGSMPVPPTAPGAKRAT